MYSVSSNCTVQKRQVIVNIIEMKHNIIVPLQDVLKWKFTIQSSYSTDGRLNLVDGIHLEDIRRAFEWEWGK